MKTYICLLRGINVSGKNLIKMESLKKLFTDMGFHHVQTYLQSGNVVFSHNMEKADKWAGDIENKITTDFGLSISVFVFSKEEWQTIFEENPFSDHEQKHLLVTLFQRPPMECNHEKIQAKITREEQYHLIDNRIYLYYPNGYGLSKLDNNVFESVTKLRATTRNWNTVKALYDMIQN